MGTKEEWEEIEKSSQQREEKIIEEYGADITKLKPSPKIEKATNIMNKIAKVICIIVAIAYTFIIVMAFVVLIAYYSNINERLEQGIPTTSFLDGMFSAVGK